MYRLEHPEYLFALLLIPTFTLVYIFLVRWRRKKLKEFGDSVLVNQLISNQSKSRSGFKFILFMISLFFIIIGVANPQIGSKLQQVKRKGIDIMICLDVSKSMNAQDIKPDRLTRSTRAIGKLIEDLSQDRIGIVVFAGSAYTQLPLTLDHGAAKLFLSTINTNVVPVQGTEIGQALDLAINSFDTEDHSKAIIVITDGENHEDDAIEMAKVAAEQGINVYTIGMGLPEGAPIPEYRGRQQMGYKKDRSGNTVISRLNQQLLADIADAGKGIAVMANNSNDGLRAIYNNIQGLDKKEFESKMFTDYEDRFQYFIAIGLLILLIDTLLLNKKSKLTERIKLFERRKD
jgi:Ca-activated chloride channel family protein